MTRTKSNSDIEQRALLFFGKPLPECQHDHQLQGSGAIFFQSVFLLRCAICGGWQEIKKPITL